MEQDLGLQSYRKQFITLEEYSKQVANDEKFDIYKNVIYDLEDSKESDGPDFYDTWVNFA